MEQKNIVLENRAFRLEVGANGITQSLVVKKTGTECLRSDEQIALFSVTQERPYNNEVKLAHPNKRTICQARSVVQENDLLIVNFEIVPVQAAIEVKITDWYITFRLKEFRVEYSHYDRLKMDKPPVTQLRLLQLPVADRAHFGEWLNVSWDESAAVNVLGISPATIVDSERRKGYRVMTADASREFGLQNCTAALIAVPADELMEAIDHLEEDHHLPRGAQSRRCDRINASAYHSANITPENVDEHIRYAKMGGFRMMLLYYPSIFKEGRGYELIGNYDYRDEYPNGAADLRRMLDHIKASGITPGLHFLHTHIGIRSRYVTPKADHRLNLKQHFTLSRKIGADDTTLWVENDPLCAPVTPECRVLRFGNELISYEGYTTEPPYCFTGCVRGHHQTVAAEHPAGEIGGVLDVCEFGATSVYLDQHSSLQEEIGEKLAEAYNCGFEFVYFDGSEGTNAPFEVHVPNAQYRVYKRFEKAPLYTEGAAKGHFSWHFLSGGNAFDVFPPPVFKRMIDRFPAEEAPRMREDFTRLNFGWWGYWVPGESAQTEPGTQPDMLEYGTSHAAAWDCPVTVITNLDKYAAHPRTADNLEVMRRWEQVRESRWLSEEQRQSLRVPGREHILLINEQREFELVRCQQITGDEPGLRAFAFEREGANWVVYWHTFGEDTLRLPLDHTMIEAMQELYEEPLKITGAEGWTELPAAGRRYVKTKLSMETVIAAFQRAEWLNK